MHETLHLNNNQINQQRVGIMLGSILDTFVWNYLQQQLLFSHLQMFHAFLQAAIMWYDTCSQWNCRSPTKECQRSESHSEVDVNYTVFYLATVISHCVLHLQQYSSETAGTEHNEQLVAAVKTLVRAEFGICVSSTADFSSAWLWNVFTKWRLYKGTVSFWWTREKTCNCWCFMLHTLYCNI